MSWIERVRRNIFPVSQEKKVLTKALNEWVYYGEMFDLENIDESCELCDHPNIRYQFVIVNTLNGNILLIGSECINRFNIGVIDKNGKILNDNEARRKVSQDKYKLIANAKTKSVINSLIMLSKQDQDFGEEKLKSFIDYFKERKAFTPEQLAGGFKNIKFSII
jgi:hypothetical protein